MQLYIYVPMQVIVCVPLTLILCSLDRTHLFSQPLVFGQGKDLEVYRIGSIPQYPSCLHLGVGWFALM